MVTPISDILEKEPSTQTSVYFLDDELNKIYQNLDPKIKKEIDEFPSKDIQKSFLKNISDSELNTIYNKLKPEQKDELDKMGLSYKYSVLKHLLKQNKKKNKKQKSIDNSNNSYCSIF